MKQRRRQNSSPNHRRLLASVALVADVQNPLKRSSYEADTLSCATKNICFLILWKYPSDLVSSPTINDKDYRFTFTPKIEPRSNQDNLRSRFTFGAPSIVILESVLPLGWRSFWYAEPNPCERAIRLWERNLNPGVCIEEERPILRNRHSSNWRVAVMLDVRLQPLNARPRDGADLVAVERTELVAVQPLEKLSCHVVREEVDESVPDVALVAEIDREVEEVETRLVESELVDNGQKHSLCVLIRDIPQHHRRPQALIHCRLHFNVNALSAHSRFLSRLR